MSKNTPPQGLIANEEMYLAYQVLCDTAKSVFLTGKAGSGKTWFLHQLRQSCAKSLVVSAPTGVAAMNAQGVTLHSFFQLPFGPIVPSEEEDETTRPYRFSQQKIAVIQNLELLIIDEISMVRADVLDAIDRTLRRYRRGAGRTLPFGGVQVLMIGDAHQLAPVAKDDEWQMLSAHYSSPYFFCAKAYKALDPLVIALTRLYRQTDAHFINLLNAVRENRVDETVLTSLNARYVPPEALQDDSAIMLCTHNHQVDDINRQRLQRLQERAHSFSAVISGDFPEFLYPAEHTLTVKIGAQVMFLKNDAGADKRFYNGKISKVVAIDQCHDEDDPKFGAWQITVRSPEDTSDIIVTPMVWPNIKYRIHPDTGAVTEEEVGRFTQFPLRLAWAITIHKSQGLTFSKVSIDAARAFSFGQIYVALSRCQTLEGVTLRSRLSASAIRRDADVDQFLHTAMNHPIPTHELHGWMRGYQEQLIREWLDFSEAGRALWVLQKQLKQAGDRVQWQSTCAIDDLMVTFRTTIDNAAKAFERELSKHWLHQTDSNYLPQNDASLVARMNKAAVYFAEQVAKSCVAWLAAFTLTTDNSTLRQEINKAFTHAQKLFQQKLIMWQSMDQEINPQKMVRARAQAHLESRDDKKPARTHSEKKHDYGFDSAHLAHPKLADKIRAWRAEQSLKEGNLPHFRILSQKQLIGVAQGLPRTSAELIALKGYGKIMVEKYGAVLIALVQEYCDEESAEGRTPKPASIDAPSTPSSTSTKNPAKKHTWENSKALSFELFHSGLTIEEIAQKRELAQSTIEGHLADYVADGKIELSALVGSETAIIINNALDALYPKEGRSPNSKISLSAIKEYLTKNDHPNIGYGAIRCAVASHGLK